LFGAVMDQAPNRPAGTGTPTAVSPAMSAWDTYYKDASRRRRAAGGNHNLRLEKRRRRFRERISIGISTLLVGAMTLVFYLLLR
jgi:hypothetical protein